MTGFLNQPGLLFVVAILCIATTMSKYTTGKCVIPDENDLLTLLLENGGVVFASPPTEETIDVNPDDMHCPVGEKLLKDAPQNARASCPWKMVNSTHDATRFPSTLSLAVSLCGSCLGADGSTMPGTRCEVVDYPTKILRQKGCEPGGVMQYGVESYQIPVASRCVLNSSPMANI